MTGTQAAQQLVLLLSLMFSAIACAKSIPVENFFRPTYSVPILSPDGHYLAVVSTDPKHPDQNLLDLIDIHTRKVIRSFRRNGCWLFNHVFWVGNRKLVFSARSNGGNFSGTSCRLFAADIDDDWTGPFEGEGYRFPATTITCIVYSVLIRWNSSNNRL